MLQALGFGQATAGPREPIRQQEEGCPIQAGVRHAAHRVGHPRPQGGEADAGAVQQVALRGRHDGGAGLVGGQHELQLPLPPRLDEVQGAPPTRHTIHPAHARPGQERRDRLYRGPHPSSQRPWRPGQAALAQISPKSRATTNIR